MITVNGERRERVPLLELVGTGLGVAVAVNGEVLPRTSWSSFVLKDDDMIEIVQATQGG